MFSQDEHKENLKRLGIDNYQSLIGKEVYYVKKSYGIHKVIAYDVIKNELLLELQGSKFYSNPFRIFIHKTYDQQ